MSNKNLLIAGGGKFGVKAIKFAKKEEYKTILIDKDSDCFAAKYSDFKIDKIEKLDEIFIKINPGGIIFLNLDIKIINILILRYNFEYIIPVVPIHLVALIISQFFKKYSINFEENVEHTKKITTEIKPNLLLNSIPQKGVIYLSYAKQNEICPDNCSGTPNYCPNFKREKLITITEYLRNFFNFDDKSLSNVNKNQYIFIIESMQLKAGLGGLRGVDIRLILNYLKKKQSTLKIKKSNFIIATTCNCHGVINCYENSIVETTGK